MEIQMHCIYFPVCWILLVLDLFQLTQPDVHGCYLGFKVYNSRLPQTKSNSSQGGTWAWESNFPPTRPRCLQQKPFPETWQKIFPKPSIHVQWNPFNMDTKRTCHSVSINQVFVLSRFILEKNTWACFRQDKRNCSLHMGVHKAEFHCTNLDRLISTLNFRDLLQSATHCRISWALPSSSNH